MICESIPGRSSEQCFYRWKEMTRQKSTKDTWTKHDSVLLEDVIRKEERPNWYLIALSLGRLGVKKTAKQCKERWLTVVKPGIIRTPWSVSEDEVIVRFVTNHGKKWSILAKKLPGRIPSHIKYRLNSILKNERRAFTKEIKNFLDEFSPGSIPEEFAGLKEIATKNSKEVENVILTRMAQKMNIISNQPTVNASEAGISH